MSSDCGCVACRNARVAIDYPVKVNGHEFSIIGGGPDYLIYQCRRCGARNSEPTRVGLLDGCLPVAPGG